MRIFNTYSSILFTSLFAISFSACSDDASFTNETVQGNIPLAQQRIAIDVNCSTPAIVDDYISLQSGDTITKEDANTSVITYHDINGSKKVCLKYGKATIIRDAK